MDFIQVNLIDPLSHFLYTYVLIYLLVGAGIYFVRVDAGGAGGVAADVFIRRLGERQLAGANPEIVHRLGEADKPGVGQGVDRVCAGSVDGRRSDRAIRSERRTITVMGFSDGLKYCNARAAKPVPRRWVHEARRTC